MIRLILFLYLVISFFVYPQGSGDSVYYDGKVYALSVKDSDVVFDRIDNYLLNLYVRKKGNINYVSLYVKDSSGNIREAYVKDNEGKKYFQTDIVEENSSLGSVFPLLIPNIIFVNDGINEKSVKINSLDDLIIRAFYDDNVYLDNNVGLNIKLTEYIDPRVEILDIQLSGNNVYSVLLKYIGGEDKDVSFYYRDGYASREYNLLQPIAGYNQKDGLSVILKDTFNNGIGKEFLIQAYFEASKMDRHLFFNAFDKNGQTETIPVQAILNGVEIKEDNSKLSKISEKKEPSSFIVQVIKKEEPIIIKKQEIPKEVPVKQEEKKEKEIIVKEEVVNIKENDIFNKQYISVGDFNGFPKKIIESISKKKGKSLDVVFVFDVTGSMQNALNNVKKSIDDILTEMYINHEDVRVGFVLFKDISDDFVVKSSNYMTDIYEIKKMIYGLNAYGGGDIEEPILDALDMALTDFSFDAENKMIFVVTDAPMKRSIYVTPESIMNRIESKHIELEYLLLPTPESLANARK